MRVITAIRGRVLSVHADSMQLRTLQTWPARRDLYQVAVMVPIARQGARVEEDRFSPGRTAAGLVHFLAVPVIIAVLVAANWR